MPVNVGELAQLLPVLAQLRDLLKEFPAQPDLVAIRDQLLAQVKTTKT